MSGYTSTKYHQRNLTRQFWVEAKGPPSTKVSYVSKIPSRYQAFSVHISNILSLVSSHAVIAFIKRRCVFRSCPHAFWAVCPARAFDLAPDMATRTDLARCSTACWQSFAFWFVRLGIHWIVQRVTASPDRYAVNNVVQFMSLASLPKLVLLHHRAPLLLARLRGGVSKGLMIALQFWAGSHGFSC